MMNTIQNIDCLAGLRLLPDASVDCIVTSPPYWSLRDYGVAGQLGAEDDFSEYVQNLCAVFDEARRVLKDGGTVFVNLGDTYGGSGNGTTKYADVSKYAGTSKQVYQMPGGAAKSGALKGKYNKALLQLPSRFALEMAERGWILRNEIIWHKPNAMPESVRDRFTVDYEKIYFFVKQKKYLFNQLLEPFVGEYDARLRSGKPSPYDMAARKTLNRSRSLRPNANGRHKRCVWSVRTKPYSGAHFAVFPEELIEPCILAGSPEGGVVLDMFMGSGTTAVCAKRLGRRFIGFELNKDYCRLAEKRLEEL